MAEISRENMKKIIHIMLFTSILFSLSALAEPKEKSQKTKLKKEKELRPELLLRNPIFKFVIDHFEVNTTIQYWYTNIGFVLCSDSFQKGPTKKTIWPQ